MKKFISVMMVLALLCSLLTACGGTGESGSGAQSAPDVVDANVEEMTPAVSATEEPEQENSVVAEEAEPEIIDTRVSYELPLFEEEQTISIWYPIRQGRATFPGKDTEQARFWYEAQNKLGVDFAWIECGQIEASEQYNLLVAGGDWPDIIYEGLCSRSGSAYNGGYEKAIEDEVYLDLAEYVEEYAPNYYHWINVNEDAHNAAYTDSGSIGAFYTINVEPALQNMGMIVNADYLDATGLDVPETMEEWEEVVVAMKNNGVAFPAVAGSSGTIFCGYAAKAMGATLDSVFLVECASDELVYGISTEETRAYLEMAAEYYEKGYIDDSFMSIVSNDSSPFTSGKVGTWEAMGQEVAVYEDYYGVRVYACPIIMSEGMEAGQTILGESKSNYVSDLPGMAVTTSCSDIPAVMKFMDWFYSDEGALIANYGWEEGVTYEVLDDGTYRELPFMEETDAATNCSNKGIYTIIGDFGLVYPNISLELANDVQRNAAEMWTPDADFTGYTYKTLPASISLNTEESNEVSSMFADIETFTQTKVLSWICGEEELNDDTWNEYLAALDSMGIEDCREAYSAAYQRYISK